MASYLLCPLKRTPKKKPPPFAPQIVVKQPVRSLIPPTIPLRTKTEPNTIRRRRNSTASVKSMTSSILSRIRKNTPTPTLASMPSEILDCIFQHLDQADLHSIMLTNSNLIEVAASYMYISPHFFSTYRYAQFVFTVSHKQHYAEMVRVLDLSYFGKGADEHGELPALAGWREFKYRHHDIYYVRDRMSTMGKRENSTHPAPSPFLKNFHRTRDVPIGSICHVLAACRRIRKVNFSRLQVASDFSILSPAYPASSTTSLIFVSDVPKSWTWRSSELTPIYADEIISWLKGLAELEVMKAKNFLWLNTQRVAVLMSECRALRKVDFRESGMQRDVRWAVKGSKEEVARIVVKLPAHKVQNTA
ncbi:hypothetical protein B7494_g169 [Chlorociboria aeruginascens]|nr:hypothetical protein B7494_g169 [Chlorociboria aeruginascens]